MMIQLQQMLDFLQTTRASVRKGKFTDISQELTRYVVVPYLLTTKGGLRIQGPGAGIEETIMHEHGGRSEWVGPLSSVSTTIIDHLKKMIVHFCLLHDNIAYTVDELRNNKGEARINNIIKPRERALWNRVAETMEEKFFETPNADDDLSPWGLKYWIVKNATTGFTGSYPAGFSRIGNINLSQVTQFKNYSATYTNITKDDLVLKMRRAHKKTKWKNPRKMKGVEGDQSNNFLILTNENVSEGFESIGEGQNQNLGRDISPFNAGGGLRVDVDGEVLFKKKPVVACEPLDDDTSDPIYGLDMDTFFAMTQKGDNMDLYPYKQLEDQPRVMRAELYHKHQTLCLNRRNNWVIYKN